MISICDIMNALFKSAVVKIFILGCIYAIGGCASDNPPPKTVDDKSITSIGIISKPIKPDSVSGDAFNINGVDNDTLPEFLKVFGKPDSVVSGGMDEFEGVPMINYHYGKSVFTFEYNKLFVYEVYDSAFPLKRLNIQVGQDSNVLKNKFPHSYQLASKDAEFDKICYVYHRKYDGNLIFYLKEGKIFKFLYFFPE